MPPPITKAITPPLNNSLLIIHLDTCIQISLMKYVVILPLRKVYKVSLRVSVIQIFVHCKPLLFIVSLKVTVSVDLANRSIFYILTSCSWEQMYPFEFHSQKNECQDSIRIMERCSSSVLSIKQISLMNSNTKWPTKSNKQALHHQTITFHIKDKTSQCQISIQIQHNNAH